MDFSQKPIFEDPTPENEILQENNQNKDNSEIHERLLEADHERETLQTSTSNIIPNLESNVDFNNKLNNFGESREPRSGNIRGQREFHREGRMERERDREFHRDSDTRLRDSRNYHQGENFDSRKFSGGDRKSFPYNKDNNRGDSFREREIRFDVHKQSQISRDLNNESGSNVNRDNFRRGEGLGSRTSVENMDHGFRENRDFDHSEYDRHPREHRGHDRPDRRFANKEEHSLDDARKDWGPRNQGVSSNSWNRPPAVIQRETKSISIPKVEGNVVLHTSVDTSRGFDRSKDNGSDFQRDDGAGGKQRNIGYLAKREQRELVVSTPQSENEEMLKSSQNENIRIVNSDAIVVDREKISEKAWIKRTDFTPWKKVEIPTESVSKPANYEIENNTSDVITHTSGIQKAFQEGKKISILKHETTNGRTILEKSRSDSNSEKITLEPKRMAVEINTSLLIPKTGSGDVSNENSSPVIVPVPQTPSSTQLRFPSTPTIQDFETVMSNIKQIKQNMSQRPEDVGFQTQDSVEKSEISPIMPQNHIKSSPSTRTRVDVIERNIEGSSLHVSIVKHTKVPVAGNIERDDEDKMKGETRQKVQSSTFPNKKRDNSSEESMRHGMGRVKPGFQPKNQRGFYDHRSDRDSEDRWVKKSLQPSLLDHSKHDSGYDAKKKDKTELETPEYVKNNVLLHSKPIEKSFAEESSRSDSPQATESRPSSRFGVHKELTVPVTIMMPKTVDSSKKVNFFAQVDSGSEDESNISLKPSGSENEEKKSNQEVNQQSSITECNSAESQNSLKSNQQRTQTNFSQSNLRKLPESQFVTTPSTNQISSEKSFQISNPMIGNFGVPQPFDPHYQNMYMNQAQPMVTPSMQYAPRMFPMFGPQPIWPYHNAKENQFPMVVGSVPPSSSGQQHMSTANMPPQFIHQIQYQPFRPMMNVPHDHHHFSQNLQQYQQPHFMMEGHPQAFAMMQQMTGWTSPVPNNSSTSVNSSANHQQASVAKVAEKESSSKKSESDKPSQPQPLMANRGLISTRPQQSIPQIYHFQQQPTRPFSHQQNSSIVFSQKTIVRPASKNFGGRKYDSNFDDKFGKIANPSKIVSTSVQSVPDKKIDSFDIPMTSNERKTKESKSTNEIAEPLNATSTKVETHLVESSSKELIKQELKIVEKLNNVEAPISQNEIQSEEQLRDERDITIQQASDLVQESGKNNLHVTRNFNSNNQRPSFRKNQHYQSQYTNRGNYGRGYSSTRGAVGFRSGRGNYRPNVEDRRLREQIGQNDSTEELRKTDFVDNTNTTEKKPEGKFFPKRTDTTTTTTSVTQSNLSIVYVKRAVAMGDSETTARNEASNSTSMDETRDGNEKKNWKKKTGRS
ncbi:hypothetical protein HK096_005072 [Nowakowskiella sp. JEL0078]|nr:hypothetical protein HK096_005072 [Nowakowskiella sp. JEL0078]